MSNTAIRTDQIQNKSGTGGQVVSTTPATPPVPGNILIWDVNGNAIDSGIPVSAIGGPSVGNPPNTSAGGGTVQPVPTSPMGIVMPSFTNIIY